MKIQEVLSTAYAMPLTSPAYPPGPYRFFNREFFTITYRTDKAAIERILPEPLVSDDPLVTYEFIRMPDSTGFGDYSESGQVIPVKYRGQAGSYSHAMFLDDGSPIVGGRELWGFPKKLAHPMLRPDMDTLVGTLDYGSIRIATGTMGYKHKRLDHDAVLSALKRPNYLLKIIPGADGSPCVCELVQYYLEGLNLKEAWTGPAALELHPHALALVADLPVREIVSSAHIIADLTLGMGTVVHDYLTSQHS